MCIGGLHCRHVGGQNKRKFAHIVCMKMTVNSQRRKILLFPSTNIAAMMSHAVLQSISVISSSAERKVFPFNAGKTLTNHIISDNILVPFLDTFCSSLNYAC